MTSKILFERITLIIAAILIPYASFCQENYLPGYIIEPDGDTLHGLIDYRNWGNNPDKISFVINPGQGKSEYTPIQIKGFSVSGEIYESAIVETEISPINRQYLEYDPGIKLETDTAFLQVMLKGTKSLYYYMTKNKKEQFFIWQDSSYALLQYKKYLAQSKNYSNIYIAENNRYIGQLTFYLNDCQTINKNIKHIQYRKKSLDKLFLYYAKCTHEEFEFHRKEDEKKFEAGMLAGLSLTDIKFSGTGYPYFLEVEYDLSANISLGIFFDYIRVKNQRKWSWCNELLLTRFKIESQYYQYYNENNYLTTYTTLALLYQKWNSMVRYKFPAGKLFLFANAGVSNGLIIGGTNYRKQEITFYDNERIEERAALDKIRKYELGFVVGLGTRFKKFSFETRFEMGNGFSAKEDLTAITNRYYFLLGYRF